MEWFRINLKTFLGLAWPNQCCLTVRKQILSYVWSYILGLKIPNLHDPYTCTVLLYCTGTAVVEYMYHNGIRIVQAKRSSRLYCTHDAV